MMTKVEGEGKREGDIGALTSCVHRFTSSLAVRASQRKKVHAILGLLIPLSLGL